MTQPFLHIQLNPTDKRGSLEASKSNACKSKLQSLMNDFSQGNGDWNQLHRTLHDTESLIGDIKTVAPSELSLIQLAQKRLLLKAISCKQPPRQGDKVDLLIKHDDIFELHPFTVQKCSQGKVILIPPRGLNIPCLYFQNQPQSQSTSVGAEMLTALRKESKNGNGVDLVTNGQLPEEFLSSELLSLLRHVDINDSKEATKNQLLAFAKALDTIESRPFITHHIKKDGEPPKNLLPGHVIVYEDDSLFITIEEWDEDFPSGFDFSEEIDVETERTIKYQFQYENQTVNVTLNLKTSEEKSDWISKELISYLLENRSDEDRIMDRAREKHQTLTLRREEVTKRQEEVSDVIQFEGMIADILKTVIIDLRNKEF